MTNETTTPMPMLDEVTIREIDEDHPTMRDYTPSIDSEPTIEDPTFWPAWSSASTRPQPN